MRYIAFIIFFLIVAVVGTSIESYYNKPFVPPEPDITFVTSDEAWETVNDWKYETAGYTYSKDAVLCKYADLRLDQVRLDWSHNDFQKLALQIDAESSFTSFGENLAEEYFDPRDALDSWLASPTHRENLDNNYTHSCIHCEDRICVQLFAK